MKTSQLDLKKTQHMRVLEVAHDQSIDKLIRAALKATTSDFKAALELDIDPSTLSAWLTRLDMQEERRKIRHAQRKAKVSV
jgi:hypothetical protein